VPPLFGFRMAVLAVQTHFACMKLMAEWNRLLRRVACAWRMALASEIKNFTYDQDQGDSQQGTDHRTTPFVSACAQKARGTKAIPVTEHTRLAAARPYVTTSYAGKRVAMFFRLLLNEAAQCSVYVNGDISVVWVARGAFSASLLVVNPAGFVAHAVVRLSLARHFG
jgi:hypothetical protein